MAGTLVIAFILVVILPMVVVMSSVLVAAGLGYLLQDEAERANEGSELIDLNV